MFHLGFIGCRIAYDKEDGQCKRLSTASLRRLDRNTRKDARLSVRNYAVVQNLGSSGGGDCGRVTNEC